MSNRPPGQDDLHSRSDSTRIPPAQFYTHGASDPSEDVPSSSSSKPSGPKRRVSLKSSQSKGSSSTLLETSTPSSLLGLNVNHLKRSRPSLGTDLDLDSEPGSSPKRATSEDPEMPHSDADNYVTRSSGAKREPSDSVVDPQIDGLLSGPWGVSEQNGAPYLNHSPRASATDRPPPNEQWRLVEGANSQTPKIGEKYFLISYQWWASFKAFCHDRACHPGPVSTKSIIHQDDLKEGLVEGEDVTILSAHAFELLSNWYGHPEQQIFRFVIPSGRNQTRIEFYPPNFTIFLLTSPSEATNTMSCRLDSPLQITLSCMAQYTSLALSISTHLKVPFSQFRIWRLPASKEVQISKDNATGSGDMSADKLREDGAELIDLPNDSQSTLADALLESSARLAVDIKIADGQWLTDSLVHDANQDLPLFEPGTDFVSALSKRATKRPDADGESRSVSSDRSGVSAPAAKLAQPPTLHQILTSNINTAPASSGGILGALGSITRSRSSASAATGSRPRGQTGLQNLGNTCFMNSALQCLSHTKELTYYFLSGVWDQDLNPSNPLGMNGQVAEAYGKLLHQLWSGQNNAFAPRLFKQVLSRFKDDFAGYRQHDSQELLAFLLDGLHEDLNRIIKKPYIEMPDWNEGDDRSVYEFGKESWKMYQKRNDSVIVDLFQGQYKSTLICPVCKKVSITFDPFMYLTLPLPINKKWRGQVFFVPKEPTKKIIRVSLQLLNTATIADLRKAIAGFFSVDAMKLVVAEIYASKFYKYFENDERVTEIGEKDIIYLFETPTEPPSARRRAARGEEEQSGMNDLIYFPVVSLSPRSSNCLGTPLIAWAHREQLKSSRGLQEAVFDRLRRYISIEEIDVTNHEDRSTPRSDSRGRTNIDEDEDYDILPTADAIDEINISTPINSGSDGDKTTFSMYLLPSESSSAMPTAWSIDRRRLEPIARTGAEKSKIGRALTPPGDEIMDIAQSVDPIVQAGLGVALEWSNITKHATFFDDKSDKRDLFEIFEDPALVQSTGRKNKTISLDDCLDEFTREEQLGQSDPWYCPQCKQHRQAFKKFDLWKIPDILVVHLKRFGGARAMRDKIDALVDAPVEGLSLEARSEERILQKKFGELGPESETLIYDLFAVDNHFGGLGGGHYTAYAKDLETDTWRNYDDSHVSDCSSASVVTSAAYLLFYRRRTNGSLGSRSWDKTVEAANKLQAKTQAEIEAKRAQATAAAAGSSSDTGEPSIPGAYSNGSTNISTPMEEDAPEQGYSAWDGGFGDRGQWSARRPDFTFGLGPGRIPALGPGTRTPSHQSQAESLDDGDVSPVDANHGSGTDPDRSPALSISSSSSSSSGVGLSLTDDHSQSNETAIYSNKFVTGQSLPMHSTTEDGDDEGSLSSVGPPIKAGRSSGVQHTYGRSKRISSQTNPSPIFRLPTQADGWLQDELSD